LMRKICTWALGLSMALCACKANRWYGHFEGNASETANIQRADGAAPKSAHAPRPPVDPDVLLERESKVAFLTFRKCRLRLELKDATNAVVSDGQTCQLPVDGENVRLAMKGGAAVKTANTVSAEISGTPTEAGITGQYSWKFEGIRKP
jgi:hypothetical protein